ncbi:16S rRNA (uracil(1498)-N(3))-methyltransferase [Psychroflexus planctonicus]|uniref:Ribosomal RNA small subunit methyltransferase E n=1 Tax=Psychroflexus planctonicus TaxID=1526575 RepID=A0ABQ1SLN3_9FLAO|nr:16S rRNA (uracil(1498)-N(3))-methyltransferase [Psychroflexus planctonicus]GGE42286.1 ribosomal RNA small subunit methyltransferase E [Psychroflexus planctonicus]
MQLFFHSDLSKNQQQADFSKIESQHIVKVLRKQVGDEIEVTNGQGDWFLCKITMAQTKRCQIEVLAHKYYPKNHQYYLHMLVAPTKSNDRFEWFLEKATEIGVDEITPILTENSERKHIKIERYQKIILSAMKQSLQFHLPKLNDLTAFENILSIEADQKWIAHCYEDENRTELFRSVNPKQNYLLCIGPEGDFSLDEVKLALQHNFEAVSLGKNRLRTETAAISACHSIAIKNSNLDA